ncbi:MAG TPA: GNAT family N-acetyltransferase [Symbiobacteriaceae bacterium]|nr:GNAT family N-acetyltransferase [Symbiobacteriaceae bacterium]
MPDFHFRRLTMEDLPLMHRWIHTARVKAVWDPDKAWTYSEVVDKYQPRTDGSEPTDSFVIMCDGQPIGYIQTYLWRDYPDYAQHLHLTEEAASLDVFIGDEAYIGKGIGPQMLICFMREIVFANPALDSCIISPEVTNVPAIKAYEKAGFRHWKTMDHPNESTPVYLMRVGRADLPSG